MKFRRILAVLSLSLMALGAFAQEQPGVVVDYSRPKTYILGGFTVEGNTYFSQSQIVSQTGMEVGSEVTIPGDDVSNIVQRLWRQRFFEDVAVNVDHLSAAEDSVFLKISIKERPRVSNWTFSGVKSGDKKDLQERLSLKKGGEFSEYVEKTSSDIIKRFYAEKGFINADVKAEVQKDSVIRNAIRVNFAVDRGDRIRIKEVNFIGNDNVKEFKLAKAMKKTKSAKMYNFFHSKKFNEKEYLNDKKTVLDAFNEAGYRDARLVKDTVYMLPPKKEGKKANRLGIDLTFEEGDKYYFRDVTWTGNSVYPTEALDQVLGINSGDVYDVVSMNKRLFGGGKQSDYDVTKLYRDNGYLFFNITPVETNIQNDSVDVEIRISEGKQATLNNIVINGNDLTNEKVVRRQIFTRPGYLFSQSDFERSIREIASLGQFDPEAIMDPSTGWSVIPNPASNTVDLIYNVTEKPSSQLEVSGGWGGRTFVATMGVSFNNFSTHRIMDKSAWRPVPLGDAQNLAFRFQTNGNYYTALSASFTEPWLTGKKPTSLNLSTYYTRQTMSNIYLGILNSAQRIEIYGVSASLGKRLKWPDNFFIMYNGLSWQTYKLTDWPGYFLFDTGIAHNLSYSLNIVRNSTDQQIYPRQGGEYSFSLQVTPPFSLLRKNSFDEEGNKIKVDNYKDVNYLNWTAADHYRWIEYHKWKVGATSYSKLVGDLVLKTSAQFGYLGYFNRNWGYSPFEGFLVGGDGMSGYNTYGQDVIALRGYENSSLTPREISPYNKENGYSYMGNVYDKFTVELRYPVMLQPNSTIFLLTFLEGGNCWSDIRKFNPFQIKRSAGVGVRIYLPMIGLLGVDWGYGFDDKVNGGSQFHFVIGQQF